MQGEDFVPHREVSVTHRPSASPVLSLEERQHLVERVAASEVLRKAARLRQLLLFLAERSFRDPQKPIKEQEIGIEVFGRDPGYDPDEDNIVRNAARQLRVKLKEYFDGEGRDEPWFLDIPKGGYRLVCEPKRIPAESTSSLLRSPQLAVSLVLLLVLSATLNLIQWRSLQADAAEGGTSLTAEIFPAGSPSPRVVVGDYGLFLLSKLLNRRFSLNEYVDRAYLNFIALPSSPPSIQTFDQLLSSRQLVSMGEANSAVSLVQCLSRLSHQPEVRHSRSIFARDLLDRPSILLGTENTNPWFSLFDQRLRFRFQGEAFQSAADPAQRFGREPPSASRGPSYARVALLRPAGRNVILLISGLNMTAVEGGTAFTTGEKALVELRNKLLKPDGELPEFEAIVETQSTDFTPTRYLLVWASPLPPEKNP
jgi:hypothetical protein